MDYKIEKKSSMTFTGYVTEIDIINGKGYSQIPALWSEVMEKNLFQGLIKYKDDLGPVGISYDYEMETGNFKYMIGIRSNTTELKNTHKLYLNEQTYGIFKAIGKMPDAIQETIQKFHTEWLPNSGFKHNGNAEIEVYSDGDPSKDDYVSYLWATIEKK